MTELLAILGFEELGKKALLFSDAPAPAALKDASNTDSNRHDVDDAESVYELSDLLVWETPSIVSFDDLIMSNDSSSGRSLQAMGVPPLPKVCGIGSLCSPAPSIGFFFSFFGGGGGSFSAYDVICYSHAAILLVFPYYHVLSRAAVMLVFPYPFQVFVSQVLGLFIVHKLMLRHNEAHIISIYSLV